MALAARTGPGATALYAALLAVYALSRLLQLSAGKVPTLLIVVLHVIPPAVFAIVHGGRTYGGRGVLVFAALCLGVGTFFESLSLRTGFPFGHYYFTSVMGPKVFQLPVLLALAYLGMGYLSWTVAAVILGTRNGTARDGMAGRDGVVLLPLAASFVMVAWDLAMDPVWTYIDHAWVWRDGGPWFGVPLSNFAGWFLTVYTFYQAFALYLRSQEQVALPAQHNRSAVIFYGISAAGNLLLSVPPASAAIIADPSGRQWHIAGITAACALISIFTMGAFTLIAWARLSEPQAKRPS